MKQTFLPITSELDTTSKYISSPVSITFTTQDSPTWAYFAFSACPKVRATEFTLSQYVFTKCFLLNNVPSIHRY